MGEQKILSKGKVPATEKEIKEVVDTIICTIDSVNDNDLSKVKPLLDKYEEYLSDDDRRSINRKINYRTTLRTNFYKTFGVEFVQDDLTTSYSLSIETNSKFSYLVYMNTRLSLYNSDRKYLEGVYKYEVDKLLEDFNAAVNLIITKYGEYQEQNRNTYKLYKFSPIKKQIDSLTNSVYDNVRLYNRNYEYAMMHPERK
jgi:hypothetical protein